MRLVIAIALSLVIFSVSAFADTETQKYNRANEFFADGDYLGALKLYNSIDIKNPDLEYNLAVTYFKLGRVGKAVLHFNRALRLNPKDEDAKANLAYINSIKKDKEKPEKVGVVRGMLSIVVNARSMSWLTVSTLFLYLLTAVAICRYIFVRKSAFAGRAIVSVLVVSVVMLGLLALTGMRIYDFENKKMAVAMTGEVVARTGPAEGADTTFIFHEGTKVKTSEIRDGFTKVTLGSGVTGWVAMSDLEKI